MAAMFGAASVRVIQDSGYVEYVVAVLVVLHLLMVVLLWRPRNLPPGPTGLPIIGCLHLLGQRPHECLAQMAQNHKQPLMSLYLGQKLCIVATAPETAMEFLKVHDATFSLRPCLRAAEIIFPKDISFSDLTPEARRMRKMFHSELVSARRIEETEHIRVKEMAHMVGGIMSAGENSVDMKACLDAMTANVFTRLIIGKRFCNRSATDSLMDDADQREFIEITDEIDLLLGTPNPCDVIPMLKWLLVDSFTGLDARYKNLRRRMESFLNKIISEHRHNTERSEDFLDALLQQMDRTDGHAITLQAVTSIIWEAFAAGMETSALVSEWTMAEVLRNPQVQRRLHKELDAVVGQARPVCEADIRNLKYLRAVVKEALRLHPIIPTLVPHQSSAPCRACGFDIPAGTQLMVNVWAIGRDRGVWGKDVLEFRPERFLEGGDSVGVEFAGKSFELLPFGSGRRMCMGMPLGTMLVEMGVANLLHCFEWSAGEVDMTEGIGLSAKKAVPLSAVATARLPTGLFT